MPDHPETPDANPVFDFGAFPPDTLFVDRRSGRDRRFPGPPREPRPPSERRARPERRKRIDPTTFDKQYTDAELEFMGAVQRFKTQNGCPFPTHRQVLAIAARLGYRKAEPAPLDAVEVDGALPS
jgi:hypothetical protein